MQVRRRRPRRHRITVHLPALRRRLAAPADGRRLGPGRDGPVEYLLQLRRHPGCQGQVLVVLPVRGGRGIPNPLQFKRVLGRGSPHLNFLRLHERESSGRHGFVQHLVQLGEHARRGAELLVQRVSYVDLLIVQAHLLEARRHLLLTLYMLLLLPLGVHIGWSDQHAVHAWLRFLPRGFLWLLGSALFLPRVGRSLRPYSTAPRSRIHPSTRWRRQGSSPFCAEPPHLGLQKPLLLRLSARLHLLLVLLFDHLHHGSLSGLPRAGFLFLFPQPPFHLRGTFLLALCVLQYRVIYGCLNFGDLHGVLHLLLRLVELLLGSELLGLLLHRLLHVGQYRLLVILAEVGDVGRATHKLGAHELARIALAVLYCRAGRPAAEVNGRVGPSQRCRPRVAIHRLVDGHWVKEGQCSG
mmetsp:Transcript_109696/g.310322  ORF Transcript_109696/g.310322 Transcript_109696/m.310322 type:complete len:410 (-) Transcript_109696:14-1243(-)